MAKTKGFLDYQRQAPSYRPIDERVNDYNEIEIPLTPEAIGQQAARCIHREMSAQFNSTIFHEGAAFTPLAETRLLQLLNHLEGKAIIYLGKIDVLGRYTCHAESFRCRNA